jgi:AAA+ superfamily predicted ATPase
MGLNVYNISASVIPLNQAELNDLIRLWERESAMSASAVYLDCEQLDISDSLRMYAVTTFIERFRGAIIISSQKQRLRLHRQMITFDVHKPTVNEQRMIWQDTVSSLDISMNGQAEKLVSQFNLSSHSIHTINSEAVERLSLNGGESGDFKEKPCDLLWNICLAQTRPHLEELAQRIKPVASLDDIVLPEHQKTILKEIAVHVRNRFKVYEDWGFVEKSSRGLGISALFIGDSGTGKTMAAEVLANELRLDLYRIDLSQVVSKYIGETEKNIKRVFDAAENGGAVLLFDEADALFGKRSEVKDSHDRYANIEISYLLQRMEAYRGLAILTTNMKDAVDTAFLRRIRFVVQFPFPDSEHRAEIWKRVFPTNTPVNGLEIDKLSRLNIAGGNICNIAMNAAFLAADKDESVSMKHILNAVRNEYAKLEKTLSTAEIGGWGDVQH